MTFWKLNRGDEEEPQMNVRAVELRAISWTTQSRDQ